MGQGKLNGKVKVIGARALNGRKKCCNFQHLLHLLKGQHLHNALLQQKYGPRYELSISASLRPLSVILMEKMAKIGKVRLELSAHL